MCYVVRINITFVFYSNKLTTFKALETEIRAMKTALAEKDRTIERFEEIIKSERDEKMDLIHEQEKFRKETEDQQRLWAEETSKLRKELDNINEIVRMNQKGAEENLRVRLEEEKMLIMNEQDSDRIAYQKLLQEYNSLEQHCENLEKELRKQSITALHKRNISDVSSISGVDEAVVSTTEIPEDHGYGSVRSTASSHNRDTLESIDWKMANGKYFHNFSTNVPTHHRNIHGHTAETNNIIIKSQFVLYSFSCSCSLCAVTTSD